MCGIAGALQLAADAPASTETAAAVVARLNDYQRARGPDGEGLWTSPDGRIVLGHRRLAIIDLSAAGAQPMSDHTGRWTITFNGEIYNYRELRAELERQGVAFRTDSDTEVLINAVAAWGEAALPKLRGMFAFALWDQLSGELWLARDPYGIKPLYVAERGGMLWFASAARALARLAPVDDARDPAGLVGFYLWGSVPEPFTWWAGIRAFPAGHFQRIALGSPAPAPKPYRRIEELYVAQPPAPLAPGELRALIHDSVRHHLVADVPVGIFLSAGVDSGVIAALAAELGGELRTITLAFDEYLGTANDEAPLAEELASRLGARHTTVRIDRSAFEAMVDDFLEAMDQPSIDGLNTWLISTAARQQGLKVALSGLGGDELFGSYPSFEQIPKLLNSFGRLPLHGSPGRAAQRMLRRLAPSALPPKMAGLLTHSGDLASAYLLRRAVYLEDEVEALLDPECMRDGLERLSTQHALAGFVRPLEAAGASLRAQISALESGWYMRNQLLRDADWAAMAHGLEIRLPFVDGELLRRLGPAIASGKPPVKSDLAACPAPRHEPASRRKTGFTTPVADWLFERTGIRQRRLRGWAIEVHRQFAQGSGVPAMRRARPNPRPKAPASPARQKRVLIFRLGSIGDFVVALPCLRLVRRCYPGARIALLTNEPVSSMTAPAQEILKGTGLVDGYFSYPGATRHVGDIVALRAALRNFAPDRLVYLPPERSRAAILRDWLFFRSCGIASCIGFGTDRELRQFPDEGRCESEAARLARTLAALGHVDLDDPASFDLALSGAERGEAERMLERMPGFRNRIIVGLSIGTKQPINNWGDDNWRRVLEAVWRPDLGLVLLGAAEDRVRSTLVAEKWSGPALNLCGEISPRVSAAVARHFSFFLCHDSGPMHLAAAVGTPCIAVFSRRNPPGQWYPCGKGHRMLYPAHPSDTIRSIRPEQVIDATVDMLPDACRVHAPAA
ncbi:MAG TPA: asparagine synthase (glutamine-hydrolyzing) [Xanthobacteraceae bacterium]